MAFYCRLRNKEITDEELEKGMENALPVTGLYQSLFHEKQTFMIFEKQGVLMLKKITDIEGNEIQDFEPYKHNEEDVRRSVKLGSWKRIGPVSDTYQTTGTAKAYKKYKQTKSRTKTVDKNQSSLEFKATNF